MSIGSFHGPRGHMLLRILVEKVYNIRFSKAVLPLSFEKYIGGFGLRPSFAAKGSHSKSTNIDFC